jgi:hypothetical protein
MCEVVAMSMRARVQIAPTHAVSMSMRDAIELPARCTSSRQRARTGIDAQSRENPAQQPLKTERNRV